jgi:hypothetical protein
VANARQRDGTRGARLLRGQRRGVAAGAGLAVNAALEAGQLRGRSGEGGVVRDGGGGAGNGAVCFVYTI